MTTKIPLDLRRFYILNNFQHGLAKAFDGKVNEDAPVGFGQLLNPYEIWYEFPREQEVVIDKIRFYNRYSTTEVNGLHIYGIDWGSNKRVYLNTIYGHTGLAFVEKSIPAMPAIRFMIFEIFAETKGQSMPDELEFWGSCKPYTEPEIKPVPAKPFKQLLGVNTFEWDLMQNLDHPWVGDTVEERRWPLLQPFGTYRHYLGWEAIEHEEGKFTFQPTWQGNWGYDEFYKRLSSEGRMICATIKGLPPWIEKTFPAGSEVKHDGAPHKFGADRTKPDAYIEYARAVFQYCARYGQNKNISLDLIKAFTPPGQYEPVREKKVGLGYIQYVELLNEMDAWWNLRQGYMLPSEYGALLSACWDGDRGRLGADVGIQKTGVKIVVHGTAQPHPDWHRGLVDWWRMNRGDELPIAAWNYHIYSYDYDATKKPWGPDADNRGVAPEAGEMPKAIAAFQWFNQVFGGNREIWMTECGYDIKQTSPLKAIPVGQRSAEQTQADWLIRTALLYSAAGHDRMDIFMLKDAGGDWMFGSCGLVNDDLSPRVALFLIKQMRDLLGDYTYAETVSKSPRIDKYKKDGSVRYVAWYETENGTLQAYQPLISKQFQTKLFILSDYGYVPQVRIEKDSFLIGETPLVYEIEEAPLIQVMNYLPISDAGRDVTCKPGQKEIVVSGVGSLDVDGKITGYKWRKVKGPRSGSFVTSTKQIATFKNMVPGTYEIELAVTDDKNGTATDTLKIIVPA